MLILNEEKYAEDLYCGRNSEVKSILAKIGYVTRYQLHILHYSDEDNYKYTVKWTNKYHNNFDESCYSNLISDAIKRAHKIPFYKIDSIKVTKSELDAISSLNNLRAEKVLFVLLCMAKHQKVSNGFTGGLVKYALPELCKTARISVPADDREYILYEIVKHGLLGYPKKNNTQCLMVNFINEDDEVALDLNEIDCKELAYVYLNWKNGGGYNKCEKCGRLFRKSKTKKYCADCVIYQPTGDKIVVCEDCGKEFSVSATNTKTCRCEECQNKANKERYIKYNIKRRGLTT